MLKEFVIIGHRQPPKPALADIPEILSGKFDYRLIQLSGIVFDARTSETNPQWTLLTIADDNKAVNVSLQQDNCLSNATYKSIIGSRATIEGVCLPREFGLRTHLGKTVSAHGASAIRITQPNIQGLEALPDIATLSLTPADKIPLFERYRTSGIVSAVWTDQAIIKTTNSVMIRISFASTDLPSFGQCIEAFGFPETDLFNLGLTHAQWRTIDDSNHVTANESPPLWTSLVPDTSNPLRWQNVLNGKLIRLKGKTLTMPGSGDGDERGKMLVQAESNVFPVFVNPTWRSIDDLKIGCHVEITGICTLNAERWHPNLIYPKARDFSIIARKSDDLRIITQPPWWTVQRLFALVGSLCALLLISLVWITALRRVAMHKGRELFREQLGHVKADLRTEERTRLAVELHDTLAQNLTGVSMEIEAANDLRGDAPQPMLDHLGIAAKALKSCRDELRNCLWDLRNQALEEPDMTKAVLKTLQPVVNDSRLAVRFNVPRARLSDNTAHALLRVIRELVVNAIRHGNATSVKVAGTIDNGKLLCSVTDDGRGFDPETAPGVLQGHFGLQGVQERVDEIGGTFEIASAPSKGTKATIFVPIPHEC